MERTDQIKLRKKAAYISLFIGMGMFVLKVGAYLITGSVAIFSDAAESVVHIAATSMALYSIILSAKPADESHPYGHGNVEYFSAGFEGFLIVLAAGVIIYEALNDLDSARKSWNVVLSLVPETSPLATEAQKRLYRLD